MFVKELYFLLFLAIFATSCTDRNVSTKELHSLKEYFIAEYKFRELHPGEGKVEVTGELIACNFKKMPLELEQCSHIQAPVKEKLSPEHTDVQPISNGFLIRHYSEGATEPKESVTCNKYFSAGNDLNCEANHWATPSITEHPDFQETTISYSQVGTGTTTLSISPKCKYKEITLSDNDCDEMSKPIDTTEIFRSPAGYYTVISPRPDGSRGQIRSLQGKVYIELGVAYNPAIHIPESFTCVDTNREYREVLDGCEGAPYVTVNDPSKLKTYIEAEGIGGRNLELIIVSDDETEKITTLTSSIKKYAQDSDGVIKVKIYGEIATIINCNSGLNNKDNSSLTGVVSFGDNMFTSAQSMFRYCANLISIPTNEADTFKNVTSMDSMFGTATNFNHPLNLNTQSVTSFSGMFTWANSFNQPLRFNTSNATNMIAMFYDAPNFNSPIEFTDTSKVTNMSQMFRYATNFNQPLDFDTSNVKSMSLMFDRAINFNQPLNFDTSNVTQMFAMFQDAKKFNYPLNSFDTSKVTDMRYMFKGAANFNQDLSGWNVDNVTSYEYFNSDTPDWVLPKPNFLLPP